MAEQQTILVEFQNGKTRVLEVEERVYPDRSVGQYESGWACFTDDSREYFIADSGEVWKQPENTVVGIAPELKAQFDKQEAGMAEALEQAAAWEAEQ